MLEIELQYSNYYLDMSDGVQYPVPKPNSTENQPASFLSSLLKKKEDWPQIGKRESKRRQQKDRACILNDNAFNMQALFSFCDYSNSIVEVEFVVF